MTRAVATSAARMIDFMMKLQCYEVPGFEHSAFRSSESSL